MSSSGPVPQAVFNTPHAGGNAQITNINGNVTYMLSEDKDRIYKWLDAPDSSGNYLAAREERHEKTGTWFIEGKEYIRWKETPDEALWVYGTPGCGKTIICSTVIEETQLRCSENPTYACAYFFFDNRNAQTEQTLHIKLIRSIIQQLCDQSDGVPAPLIDIYGNGRQQVSIASLQSTLRKIMDGFERTYIIIDALDECTNRDKVLAWIQELMQWKAGKIHVLFSSRPEQDIKDKLRCLAYIARVTLNSRLAEKDIETYIDAMLSTMINKWDAKTIARVRDALITRSDGMFRWVALQISELLKCCNRKAVDDQLRDLPKDLEGMYERFLLNSPRRQDLKRFLMWLAFSSRPLEPQELADVVTVDLASNRLPSYDENLRYFSPTGMLITCSSFVTEIEAEKEEVPGANTITLISVMKLAHMSVKDYLVSDRLKNGPASYFSINARFSHSWITKTCLAYLFHLGSLCCINDSVLESFPLSTYAAQHWINHMRLGGGEDEHHKQMMDCIFSLEGKALHHWVCLDDPDEYEWYLSRENYEKQQSKIAAPLYYACIRGLNLASRLLLIGGAALDAQGGHYSNALQDSSLKCQDAIVRFLLKQGAYVNAEGGYYGHALQAASQGGHDEIVRLLLEQGAYVNAEGGHYGYALQAASQGGHDEIVRLLLENGADVNAQGGRYGNALLAASHYGHDSIIQLLLENGADVAKGNALQATSRHGHIASVRVLLKNGADINEKGGHYGNALQAASYRGNDSIVRLLLEQGADVNAQGGEYGNALQAASQGGHDEIVRGLLEKGADLNVQGGEYGNALQAASRYGHDSIVRLLLERGAAVNAQGGCYGSALQAASKGGHVAIIQLLLEHGADVKAQGGQYGSALKAARYQDNFAAPRHKDHELAVKLLLECGAIDEDSEGQAKRHREDENKEQDSEVDGAEIERDDSSMGNSSDDEWASAQESSDYDSSMGNSSDDEWASAQESSDDM